MKCSSRTSPARIAALALAALAAGCAAPPPPVGTSEAAVLASRGAPTARYDLPDGAHRLEYATGPYGRETWMIDIGADGRVQLARQVLGEAEFLRVQSHPGIPAAELLRWIGSPGERRGARRGGQTWSWRYPTHECLWFQASIDAAGVMTDAAYAIDPTCDHPDSFVK